MKKYQQLILVILSVFSFVSLLIYRHEYNKLRYVLEVFNFFGTPGVPSHQNAGHNVSVDKYIMSEPLPAWQRVSDTLYLYSAYWEVVGNKGHVKAPAIGVLNENLNYGCYLWYEFHPNPVKAQFSFSELPRKNSESAKKSKSIKTKGFMFYCEAGNDETSQAFLPIYKIKTDRAVQNSTAICVLPNEFYYLKKRNYLEFLTFHRVIGIKDFIIYGANFQYNIISPILKDPSLDTNLMVLQWNYPFYGDSHMMLYIAENDCILRASGLYENVIILKWNQFFVPNTHSSAQTIISNLDPEKKMSVLQIYTSVFCLEYNDDPSLNSTQPLIFRKTRYALLKNDDPVLIYNTNVKTGATKRISSSIVNVHWYAKCNNLELKLKKKADQSMLMFESEIMQSKIMRL
ncbi:UNVERIFIED_CONTAM: hypothetical protein PYX00_000687 [Menopon gallinae]|uniref:Glycosyltransferase family 92 protein n=1 Tax=Menopon gallinae TaxID=328185 RepID=A0AAW2IA26_9NEOP